MSTQLIKPNYLVILPPTQHHSFFRNLPPPTQDLHCSNAKKTPSTVLRNYCLSQHTICFVLMQRQHLLWYFVTTAYVRQDLLCSDAKTTPSTVVCNYGLSEHKICFVLMQRQHLLRYYVTTAYVRQGLLCSNAKTTPSTVLRKYGLRQTRFALL